MLGEVPLTYHSSWAAKTDPQFWLSARGELSGKTLISPVDPKNSFLIKRIKFYTKLPSETIANNMPLVDKPNGVDTAFSVSDYETLVRWVTTLGQDFNANDPISTDVKVVQKTLSETGLNLQLACTKDATYNLTISNPLVKDTESLDNYVPLQSTADGLGLVQEEMIAKALPNGQIGLTGFGDDIWEQKLYFTALQKPIKDTKLDLMLELHEVTGDIEDFSKVGILISDSADLSGQMVFVHWSGKHGLAEDSGIGRLNLYRKIAEQQTPAGLTSLPVRIRATYEGGGLLVGACFDCTSPPIGMAKNLNFVPKYVSIVASPHNLGSIKARVSIFDAYTSPGISGQLSTQTFQCVNGRATIDLPAKDLGNLERLSLSVTQNNQLVLADEVVKTFSQEAACSVKSELMEPKLRRLSELQIKNSVRAVFGDIFPVSVWPSFEDGTNLLSMDTMADKLNMDEIKFERWLKAVDQLVPLIIEKKSDIAACANATSPSCALDILRSYGVRLWRKPLPSNEMTDFSRALDALPNNKEKLTFVFKAILLSHHFLFRSEIGRLEQGIYVLDNYEKVSLLSYAVLNQGPDDRLLALASQSADLSLEQMKAELDRLVQSDAATQAWVALYKDYLKLSLVLTKSKDSKLNFTPDKRSALIESAELMLKDKIAYSSHYMDPFKSSAYYANESIAEIFGASVQGGQQKIVVSDNERFGILNHPAFLASHATANGSGIVKRGIFTLEQLLCEKLPPPPGNVMTNEVPPNINPDTTSERDLLIITHSSQAGCDGCHQYIDPAGFGFENFDTLGRFRLTEKQGVPIDASGILTTSDNTRLMYNNGAEYSKALTTSPAMQSCVKRKFLEHYLGQPLAKNSCEIGKFENHLRNNNETLEALLASLVALESFSYRQLQQH